MAIIIYATGNGHLDTVAVTDISVFQKDFIAFLGQRNQKLLDTVAESREFAPETEEILKTAIADFRDNYFKK